MARKEFGLEVLYKTCESVCTDADEPQELIELLMGVYEGANGTLPRCATKAIEHKRGTLLKPYNDSKVSPDKFDEICYGIGRVVGMILTCKSNSLKMCNRRAQDYFETGRVPYLLNAEVCEGGNNNALVTFSISKGDNVSRCKTLLMCKENECLYQYKGVDALLKMMLELEFIKQMDCTALTYLLYQIEVPLLGEQIDSNVADFDVFSRSNKRGDRVEYKDI